MKIDPFKALKANVSAFALTTILVGCAGPQQGSLFENSSNAIRAAETAGAREFAPTQYQQANYIFEKAEAMHLKRRTDRAQKLLQLATAQANLAKAMSEAAQAEASLDYLRTSATSR